MSNLYHVTLNKRCLVQLGTPDPGHESRGSEHGPWEEGPLGQSLDASLAIQRPCSRVLNFEVRDPQGYWTVRVLDREGAGPCGVLDLCGCWTFRVLDPAGCWTFRGVGPFGVLDLQGGWTLTGAGPCWCWTFRGAFGVGPFAVFDHQGAGPCGVLDPHGLC